MVEPLTLGGALADGLLPMPTSYTALLWPQEAAMARLRAEVKNLRVPGTPDPNAEKYQALSLAVEQLPSVEVLLARWLPDAAGRYLVLCEDDAAAAQTAEQAEKLFGAGTHIYKDAEGFAADEAATPRRAALLPELRHAGQSFEGSAQLCHRHTAAGREGAGQHLPIGGCLSGAADEDNA